MRGLDDPEPEGDGTPEVEETTGEIESASDYAVGDCVRQASDETTDVIDCADLAGGEDFTIVSEVDDAMECVDAGMWGLTVDGRTLCLDPS